MMCASITHKESYDKGRYYMVIIQFSISIWSYVVSVLHLIYKWYTSLLKYNCLYYIFQKCRGSEIRLSNIWPSLMFATIISISYKYCLFFWHLPISSKLYDGIVLLQRYRLFSLWKTIHQYSNLFHSCTILKWIW